MPPASAIFCVNQPRLRKKIPTGTRATAPAIAKLGLADASRIELNAIPIPAPTAGHRRFSTKAQDAN